MRRIIDKILREEEGEKICPSCDSRLEKSKDKCDSCSYDFDVKTSTPEDGI